MSENENLSFNSKINQSIYVGISRFGMIFLLSHPFDLMKTRLQANPIASSMITLPREVYKENGLRGFYKGGIPSFSRGILKEGMRSPLRGYWNHFYSENLPSKLRKKYPDLKNVLTGLTVSTFDTFILCPLERIKVWFMTNQHRNESLYSYFHVPANEPLPEHTTANQRGFLTFKDLFRGYKAAFCRSTISWCSYLIIEERVRSHLLEKEKKGSSTSLSLGMFLLVQAKIGVCCGLFNTLVTLPFDTVKTHLQKRDLKTSEKSIIRIMIQIYKTHGVFYGLYAGWKFRLPQYVIVAMITSSNLQKVDEIWSV